MILTEHPGQSAVAEVRVEMANARAAGHQNMPAGMGSAPPLIEATIEETDAARVGGDVDAPQHFDWNLETTHRRFARLERKVGRKAAPASEVSLYATMLSSRRQFVFAADYMHEYAEIERIRAVRKKLQELQQLLKPVPR